MALFRKSLDSNSPVAEAAALTLRITGPGMAGVERPVPTLPAVLGRSSVCEIQLDHEQVSRRHAKIEADANGLFHLTDLNSRNGVLVHGRTTHGPIPLVPGTRIDIGPYLIQVAGPLGGNDDDQAGSSITPIDDSAHSTLVELEKSRATFNPEILTHLHQLDDELVRLPSVSDRYQRICEFVIHENRGTQYCAVIELNPEATDQSVWVHRSASQHRHPQPPYVSQTLVGRVSESRQPMMLSNIGEPDAGLMLSLAADAGEVSAIACPLHPDEGPLLYATFDRHAVSDRWLDLLVLVADQFRHAEAMVSMVMQAQQSAMIDRDLERARQIQLGLLPDAWEHPALDLAIGFEPCASVGGDYADIIAMPDGRVFAAIADVAGKGLPAALISSSIHTMVHAVIDAGGTPAQAMRQLNGYLIDFAPLGAFATMLMLAIDPVTGRTEVLNAGHLPIALLRADRSAELLAQGKNLPLGIDPQEYEPDTLTLAPGDAWLLYSDGLSEMTTTDAEMLGNEGVCEIGRQLLKPTAAQTVQALLSWITEHSADPEQADDQTLMVLRRMG